MASVSAVGTKKDPMAVRNRETDTDGDMVVNGIEKAAFSMDEGWEDESSAVPPPPPLSIQAICRRGRLIKGRYEVVDFKNQGSFGWVMQAFDMVDKDMVAIKVSKDGKSDTLRKEVNVLVELARLDPNREFHIVSILDGFNESGRAMMISEFMSMSMREYLATQGEFIRGRRCGFSIIHTKIITYQILQGLNYLYRMGIVHTDIKPDNIMFTSNYYDWLEVKLIDFGTVEIMHDSPVSYLTQTRYYRCPEVMLNCCPRFTSKMDIWSFGCTLAEIYTGQILFRGSTMIKMLVEMVTKLGPLPNPLKRLITYRPYLQPLERAAKQVKEYSPIGNYVGGPIISDSPPCLVRLLSKECRRHDGAASFNRKAALLREEAKLISLITQMLKYNPAERITAHRMIEEPFLRTAHFSISEPFKPNTF